MSVPRDRRGTAARQRAARPARDRLHHERYRPKRYGGGGDEGEAENWKCDLAAFRVWARHEADTACWLTPEHALVAKQCPDEPLRRHVLAAYREWVGLAAPPPSQKRQVRPAQAYMPGLIIVEAPGLTKPQLVHLPYEPREGSTPRRRTPTERKLLSSASTPKRPRVALRLPADHPGWTDGPQAAMAVEAALLRLRAEQPDADEDKGGGGVEAADIGKRRRRHAERRHGVPRRQPPSVSNDQPHRQAQA